MQGNIKPITLTGKKVVLGAKVNRKNLLRALSAGHKSESVVAPRRAQEASRGPSPDSFFTPVPPHRVTVVLHPSPHLHPPTRGLTCEIAVKVHRAQK